MKTFKQWLEQAAAQQVDPAIKPYQDKINTIMQTGGDPSDYLNKEFQKTKDAKLKLWLGDSLKKAGKVIPGAPAQAAPGAAPGA